MVLSNINTVLDRLYIGDLSAAKRPPPFITHILSVCPDLPSLPPSVAQPRRNSMNSNAKYPPPRPIQHLCIPVQDTEHTDILPHLRPACSFIRAALREDENNRVLVHCVMGISRSATVICAFLMMTHGWDTRSALAYLRTCRPQVHPNYGFMRQLDIFAQCGFNPSPTNPTYVQWTRKRKREVNKFLSRIQDVVSVLGERVYICEELPADPHEAEMFLDELEVAHLITLSSSSSPSSSSSTSRFTLSPTPISSSSSLSSQFTDSGSNLNSMSASSSASTSLCTCTCRTHTISLLPSTLCSQAATSVSRFCAKAQAQSILPTPDVSPKSSPVASPTTFGGPGGRGSAMMMNVEVDAFMKNLWVVLRDLDEALEGGKRISRRGLRSGSGSGYDGDGMGVSSGKVLICSQEMCACVVVCSYMMWKSGLSPSAAFAKLEDSLPLFNPTSTFFSHLSIIYEAMQVTAQFKLDSTNGSRLVSPGLSPSSSSSSSSSSSPSSSSSSLSERFSLPSLGSGSRNKDIWRGDVNVNVGDEGVGGESLLGMSRLSLDERAAGMVLGGGMTKAGPTSLRRGLRTVGVGAV